MARYTHLFTTAIPVTHLRQSLADVFTACNLNVIYEASGYLVAREKPGHVSYSKLATVELLIDLHHTPTQQQHPDDQAFSTTINLVVTNEELPFMADNHCQQIFETVSKAVTTVSLKTNL